MSDSEKFSIEEFPLTKAFMQDLYDKFDAAYAAYNTYRTVVDAAELYMPHFEINPQKRPWVGLTADEVDKILDDVIGFNSCWGPETDFAEAIEAKLKEKNNG